MWVAEWEREQSECPHCGNQRSECSDPAVAWSSFRSVCYATMEQAAATAFYDALHADEPFHDGTFRSWSKTRSAKHPYKHDEGVAIGVARTDPAPWDQFTKKRDASPVQPADWDDVDPIPPAQD